MVAVAVVLLSVLQVLEEVGVVLTEKQVSTVLSILAVVAVAHQLPSMEQSLVATAAQA